MKSQNVLSLSFIVICLHATMVASESSMDAWREEQEKRQEVSQANQKNDLPKLLRVPTDARLRTNTPNDSPTHQTHKNHTFDVEFKCPAKIKMESDNEQAEDEVIEASKLMSSDEFKRFFKSESKKKNNKKHRAKKAVIKSLKKYRNNCVNKVLKEQLKRLQTKEASGKVNDEIMINSN